MLTTVALLFLAGLIFVYPLVALVRFCWQVAGHPIALRFGVVAPTRDDLVVRGWDAERDGRWENALASYEEALLLQKWDEEAEARRANLLQQHPELAEEAERAQRKRLAALSPPDVFCYLAQPPSDRKLRFVAAAFCRCVCDPRTTNRIRAAIEMVESRADQLQPAVEVVTIESLSAMYEAEEAESNAPAARAVTVLHMALWMPVVGAIDALLFTAESVSRENQVRLLECIFGLRGRTREAAPAWLTSTAVALARQMYESRDFSAMPILADALQDAGCDSADVLNHCRATSGLLGEPPAGSPNPPPATHVRGCWVCDLVLGKE